jgi:hypothetical protein
MSSLAVQCSVSHVHVRVHAHVGNNSIATDNGGNDAAASALQRMGRSVVQSAMDPDEWP